MAVLIMSKNENSLITQLQKDFDLAFTVADSFYYSDQKKAIFYNPNNPDWQSLLLHELAHFILKHRDYQYDRQLLRMETDAWELAKDKLANQYDVDINYDLIEQTLDSYRDWLYQRSKCPSCQAIGNQASSFRYKCLSCDTIWRVNQAKFTRLKRSTIKK